jgi:hypothetical protein
MPRVQCSSPREQQETGFLFRLIQRILQKKTDSPNCCLCRVFHQAQAPPEMMNGTGADLVNSAPRWVLDSEVYNCQMCGSKVRDVVMCGSKTRLSSPKNTSPP